MRNPNNIILDNTYKYINLASANILHYLQAINIINLNGRKARLRQGSLR